MADTKPTASPASSPTATTDPRRLSEVVIELGDDRCRNMMWPLTKVVLRGRWSRSNIPTSAHQSFASMPDLPGVHISCDPSRKRARVFDVLSDPSNEELLLKAQKVYQEAFQERAGPEKTVLYENLSDNEIRTWLWEMRKAVDGKRARVVHGELPTREQIEGLPGRTRIELNSNSSTGRRFQDDPPVDVRR